MEPLLNWPVMATVSLNLGNTRITCRLRIRVRIGRWITTRYDRFWWLIIRRFSRPIVVLSPDWNVIDNEFEEKTLLLTDQQFPRQKRLKNNLCSWTQALGKDSLFSHTVVISYGLSGMFLIYSAPLHVMLWFATLQNTNFSSFVFSGKLPRKNFNSPESNFEASKKERDFSIGTIYGAITQPLNF